MRDVNTLIVKDIFEDNGLYMEISRNFSDSQNLGGLYLAIKDITWITLKGLDVLVLEYHEGEDRELLTEVIPIENGEEAVSYNELDELEKEYDILEYDICSPVLYDFENVDPTIKAHAEYEMRNHEEICQKYGKQLNMSLDYHTFDFNDDGHKQIVVLNEKIEGYYDIVLSWSNLVLKYDAWYNRYKFCDQ